MSIETKSADVAASSCTGHGYRDFSQVITLDDPAVQFLRLSMHDEGHKARPTLNFPAQLHYVLSELEADGMDNLCGYQPHGRCFVVRKHDAFVEQVLCRWFRQTKFTSFQRQLNIYGFCRITSGPDKGAYYHPLFLRGKPFLAEHIPRQCLKGNGPRRPSHITSHPNFYTMTFLPTTTTEVDTDRAFTNRRGIDPSESELITPNQSSHARTEPALVNQVVPSFVETLTSMTCDHNVIAPYCEIHGIAPNLGAFVPTANDSLSANVLVNLLVQREMARSLTLQHHAALRQHQLYQQNRNRRTLIAVAMMSGAMNLSPSESSHL